MGLFNLLSTPVQCSACKEFYDAELQYKYAHTRQINHKIGDKLYWLGSNDIGVSGTPAVKVHGVLDFSSEKCPKCGSLNGNEEYYILVENDIVISIEHKLEKGDFLDNDGDFFIVDEFIKPTYIYPNV